MRTIVIGDVHGCYDELLALLDKVKVTKDDRVVFVGDLVDRGPKPVEVVNFVRVNKYECVIGNHCEKHVRYRHHVLMEKQTGKKNPMRPFTGERLEQHNALVETGCVDYLASLPAFIHLDDKWTVVHAGLLPNQPIEQQDPKKVCRIRYLDGKTHKMLSLDDMEKPKAEGAVYWTQVWPGPRSIIYGHNVHDLENPSFSGGDYYNDGCWGIDTGCCFGGHLTAAILQDGKFVKCVSVKAEREYFPMHKAKSE